MSGKIIDLKKHRIFCALQYNTFYNNLYLRIWDIKNSLDIVLSYLEIPDKVKNKNFN